MQKLFLTLTLIIVTHAYVNLQAGEFYFVACSPSDSTACGNTSGGALNYCQGLGTTNSNGVMQYSKTQGVCIPMQFKNQNNDTVPGIFNNCNPQDKIGACGGQVHAKSQAPYYLNYLYCAPYPIASDKTTKTGICLTKD